MAKKKPINISIKTNPGARLGRLATRKIDPENINADNLFAMIKGVEGHNDDGCLLVSTMSPMEVAEVLIGSGAFGQAVIEALVIFAKLAMEHSMGGLPFDLDVDPDKLVN